MMAGTNHHLHLTKPTIFLAWLPIGRYLTISRCEKKHRIKNNHHFIWKMIPPERMTVSLSAEKNQHTMNFLFSTFLFHLICFRCRKFDSLQPRFFRTLRFWPFSCLFFTVRMRQKSASQSARVSWSQLLERLYINKKNTVQM